MSEAATCPRCGAPFLCGARDARCDCFDLELGAALRERVGREFAGCLCLACLKELGACPRIDARAGDALSADRSR
ncbi:MAG: cysteine-rich CWC family protein [Pelomonas sp.]|nr:cysteine-rich CWC family protein [Roseateles sp.]